MELLVAIGHFVGALLALAVLKLSLDFSEISDNARYGQRLRHEIATKLGIRRDQVDSLEWDREVAKLLEEKFSDDRFGNRVADLLGPLMFAWYWLGIVILFAIFVGAAWATFAENLEAAVSAWSLVLVWAIFSILGALFRYLCNFLTGRYPGQPKKTRAELQKAARVIDERTTR